ncbi:hypothetical protein Emed_004918 [Eimeria media]
MEGPAETGLPTYSDAEDEDAWMPFQRSAPDFVSALAFCCWATFGGYRSEGRRRLGSWGLSFSFPGHASRTSEGGIGGCWESFELLTHLGCGDGRFIVECCRLTNCAGLGVDLDEGLIAKAKANAAAAGNIRAEFCSGDFLDPALDLLPATVIFVYLLPEALQLLAPRLEELITSSPSLRCIVSLCWPLYALEASSVDRERRFFLYQREDLQRQMSERRDKTL